MSHLPYRRTPIRADNEAIRRANEALGRSAESRYLPVDEEARRIAAGGLTELSTYGELLATHPDEAVPMLAARITGFRSMQVFSEVALARALRDAEASGHVWTPLLDVLATTAAWPISIHTEEGKRWWGDRRVPRPSEQAGKLAEWIAAQENPEALDDLFDFHAEEILHVIAAHASCLSEGQVRKLLTNRVATNHLVRNKKAATPHVDLIVLTLISQAEQFKKWWDVTELLQKLARSVRFPKVAISRILSIVTQDGDGSFPAFNLLINIDSTPEDVLRILWGYASQKRLMQEQYKILTHPQASMQFWEWAYTEQRSSFPFPAYLVRNRDLSIEQQLFLYDRAHEDQSKQIVDGLVDAFLDNLTTSIEILRRIANDYSHSSIRLRLAQIPKARKDAEVAGILASSNAKDVIWELVSNADTHSEAFIRAWEKARRLNASRAQSLLGRRMKLNPCPVPADWLIPFLNDSDPQVREAAITWLGHAKGITSSGRGWSTRRPKSR